MGKPLSCSIEVKVVFWILVRVVGLGHLFWAHIWGIGQPTSILWRGVGDIDWYCHFSILSYLLLQLKLCLRTSHLQILFVKTVKILLKNFRIKNLLNSQNLHFLYISFWLINRKISFALAIVWRSWNTVTSCSIISINVTHFVWK